MNRAPETRRRRPFLIVFAAVVAALMLGAVVLIVRVSSQIEATAAEYDDQADRVTTMNYVHRETLVWQSQLASLGTDRDFAALRLRRALLERQLTVTASLSMDTIERQAMAATGSALAKVDRIVAGLSPRSSAEDFEAAWRSIKAPLATIASTLKQLYHHREQQFLASVEKSSREASRSKILLAALGGCLMVLGGAFGLTLRHAIRTDFRRAYRALQAEMSDREAAERDLATKEAHFRSLVQNSSDVITVFDLLGEIRYESASVERNLGFTPDARVGSSVFETVDAPERLAEALADVTVRGDGPRTVEIRMRDRSGAWRDVEATITNLLDDDNVAAIVMNHRDISERKTLELELRRQAMHDPLTGLANRALFRERVEAALHRRDVDHRRPSVLFIDVDDFKTVNDGFGHDAGDRLLIEVADRLRRCVRPEDLVARLGGDEFAILVEEDGSSETVAIEVAKRALLEMGSPYAVSERQLFIDASIGIASWRSKDDANMLLRQADTAMYMAKARGKARFELFSPSMGELIRRRVDLESELRAAIESDELFLDYQPIVSLPTGEITALEALVRWDHPTRGILPPSAFLPMAEETGLITALGRRTLNQACAQLRVWLDGSPGRHLKMSVNLSSRQLRDETIVRDVASAIAEAGISPDALIIEVTESVVSHDVERVASILHELKQLGVQIAIDDFGTGYSSLSHLRQFPVDILKVDKSFVDGVGRGPEETALAHAILKIGQSFDLQTIAEGVEDQKQDIELRRLGYSHAQGNYYSRPVDPGIIEDLLTTSSLAGALLQIPSASKEVTPEANRYASSSVSE
ncbi:MAG: EAL domain-containing protein [Actinomycetota bacterium]